MRVLKWILGIIILIPIIGVTAYYAMNVQTMEFETICKKDNPRYTDLCENVGKRAFSKKSLSALNNEDYGQIIGVAWRKKDSIISSTREKRKRRAESNSYYYILKSDEGNIQFLRLVDETDAK